MLLSSDSSRSVSKSSDAACDPVAVLKAEWWNGTFRTVWDLTMFATLVYQAIMLPLRLALYPVHVSWIEFAPHFAIDLVIDAIAVMDMYWRSTRFGFVREKDGAKELVMAPDEIRKQYMGVPCLMDAVSSAPMDFILVAAAELPAVPMVRINRLLRLHRLPEYLKQAQHVINSGIDRLYKRPGSQSRTDGFNRIVESFFGLLFFSHTVWMRSHEAVMLSGVSSCVIAPCQAACLWIWVGHLSSTGQTDRSWMASDGYVY